MAVRHNLCANPAVGNNVTGWGGGSTPTLTAVSGFGRPNAARYTTGTFVSSASGVASPTLVYTVSAYIRHATFNITSGASAYVEWLNAGSASLGSTAGAAYTATAGVVTRASASGTAPANTAFARLILDGVNYSVNALDVTMVLIEQVASLDTYFDGDDVGATWDGTPGNSASTLTTGAAPSATPQPVVVPQAAVMQAATW